MATRRRRKKKKRIAKSSLGFVVLILGIAVVTACAVWVVKMSESAKIEDESETVNEKMPEEEKEEEIYLADYTEKMKDEAVAELERMGFVVSISEEENSLVEEGMVIRQLPSAGKKMARGERVRLFVSSGTPKFEIDDYIGISANDAKGELKALGAEVKIVQEYADTEAAGNVFYQEPEAGEMIRKGDEVVLYVSLGAAMVKVPKITDMTLSQAEDKLMASGLHLGDITEVVSEKSVETVLEQSIAPGTEVELDTVIDVKVSGN